MPKLVRPAKLQKTEEDKDVTEKIDKKPKDGTKVKAEKQAKKETEKVVLQKNSENDKENLGAGETKTVAVEEPPKPLDVVRTVETAQIGRYLHYAVSLCRHCSGCGSVRI